jgi:hypothetical protein
MRCFRCLGHSALRQLHRSPRTRLGHTYPGSTTDSRGRGRPGSNRDQGRSPRNPPDLRGCRWSAAVCVTWSSLYVFGSCVSRDWLHRVRSLREAPGNSGHRGFSHYLSTLPCGASSFCVLASCHVASGCCPHVTLEANVDRAHDDRGFFLSHVLDAPLLSRPGVWPVRAEECRFRRDGRLRWQGRHVGG